MSIRTLYRIDIVRRKRPTETTVWNIRTFLEADALRQEYERINPDAWVGITAYAAATP